MPTPRMHALLPLRIAAAGFLVVWALLGCDDPDRPTVPPEVSASVTVLSLHSTNPDPNSAVTCQTGAGVLLEAHGSHDPAGQPIEFEWRDAVDYGDGMLVQAPDWGSRTVLRTMEFAQPASLSTVGFHYVTLTVRTRDGRSASQTLRVTVTACEDCGA
jgi:hypothetical protein